MVRAIRLRVALLAVRVAEKVVGEPAIWRYNNVSFSVSDASLPDIALKLCNLQTIMCNSETGVGVYHSASRLYRA